MLAPLSSPPPAWGFLLKQPPSETKQALQPHPPAVSQVQQETKASQPEASCLFSEGPVISLITDSGGRAPPPQQAGQ